MAPDADRSGSSGDPETGGAPADANEVFGSLPRRRPGIESPRRAKARTATRDRAAADAGEQPVATGSGSELEQLARAGARLAAGAASMGLKLAGRTVGGLGRVVGRR